MIEEIKNIYGNPGKERLKAVLTGLIIFFLLMVSSSFFEGAPFSYEEQRYRLVVCGILSVIIVGIGCNGYIIIRILKNIKKIDLVMLQECDVIRYLELIEFAVSYGKTLSFKSYQKSIFILIQQRYIAALIANDKLNAAEDYLTTEWTDYRTTAHKNSMTNLKLVVLYRFKDVQKFDEIYKQSPIIFQKNKLFKAYSFILNEKYEDCKNMLSAYTEKNAYNEVGRNYLLGLCYSALEDEKSAKACMEYVMEHGNTMPHRKKAEEWLLKHS